MKKVIALLLASVFSISLLTACGAKPEPTTEKSETKVEQTQPAAETAEKADAATQSPETAAVPEKKELKVGAIFAGAINDGSWNETQYNGLKRIEALGASITYMENISDTDAAEAARTYATEGFDLVYLSTNSYQDYCILIAKDFPDTTFVQINGTEVTDNFISVRVADEEQGFMQGAIAALLSKTGKVGFVGGLEINPIILGSSGFQQGVGYVNANYDLKVEAKRVNTGSFTDVNKAKETAISLIESGCDVMAPMADDSSVGIMEAAEEKNIMAVSSGVSLVASAPKATQIVVVKDISLVYDATYDAFLNGTLKTGEVETYGISKGVVFLSDWEQEVSADIQSKVSEIIEKLKKGEIAINTQV